MRAPGITQLLLACALILGIAAGTGTAAAESADGLGVDAFSRAVSAYESGDWNGAAAAIDDAMKAGLSKDLQARAMNLRAHIDEHSGALARALQDYSTALWMDTLPQSERKDAQEGKRRVIAAMGLNSYTAGAKHANATPDEAPQASSGGSSWSMFNVFGSSSPAPQPAPVPAPPPAQSAQSSSGGTMWGMFNVFGSSNPAPEPAPAPPPAQTAAVASTSAAAPATSASRIVTRAKPATVAVAKPPKPAAVPRPMQAVTPKPQPPVRMAAIQPAAAPAAASAAGGFMIVFGSAPSEGAGRARAGQIKAALADILVSRTVDVEAGASGYQIVAGPYKTKAAAAALCGAMRQRGVSCQVAP